MQHTDVALSVVLHLLVSHEETMKQVKDVYQNPSRFHKTPTPNDEETAFILRKPSALAESPLVFSVPFRVWKHCVKHNVECRMAHDKYMQLLEGDVQKKENAANVARGKRNRMTWKTEEGEEGNSGDETSSNKQGKTNEKASFI